MMMNAMIIMTMLHYTLIKFTTMRMNTATTQSQSENTEVGGNWVSCKPCSQLTKTSKDQRPEKYLYMYSPQKATYPYIHISYIQTYIHTYIHTYKRISALLSGFWCGKECSEGNFQVKTWQAMAVMCNVSLGYIFKLYAIRCWGCFGTLTMQLYLYLWLCVNVSVPQPKGQQHLHWPLPINQKTRKKQQKSA